MIPVLDALPEPRSAWLLIGDAASLHDRPSLRYWFKQLSKNDYETWTCSPLVEVGDLLFIYYMAPDKAILEVTRAISRPRRDRRATITSLSPVSRFQWMVEIAPPIQIQPVDFKQLSEAMGGHLVLKGRSGKYVPPSVANVLIRQMKVVPGPTDGLEQYIRHRVVGRDDLPRGKKMNLSTWSGISSSLLRLEKEVEQSIIEPLLKLCGIGREYQIKPQCRVGRGCADYVITSAGKATCVIEAKQRVDTTKENLPWSDSADYRQLRNYASSLGCSSALIDCDQIFLFDAAAAFVKRFDRRDFSSRQLAVVAKHLKGG